MRRDEEGFYYVMDSIKNLYISGAENIYSAEVEYMFKNLNFVYANAISNYQRKIE